MTTRSLVDVVADENAELVKLERLRRELSELDTRDTKDAGTAQRIANVGAGVARSESRLAELFAERQEAGAEYTKGAPPEHFESGDDSGDVSHVAAKAAADKVFGKPPEPWLPGIREYRKLQTKAIGTTGAFIPVAYAGTFFDLLRKRTAVLAAGPVIIPVRSAGSIRVPKVTSSVTIAGIAEGAAITPADPGLGDILLDPKKYGALTLVNREAIEDSAPQLREVVANALIRDLAVELDRQLVTGDGIGANLRGLRNVAGVTAGPSLGANGASLTYAHLADTMAAAEQANADPDRLAWIMHARTWGSVRKLADTSGQPVFNTDPSTGLRPSIFGRPVFISNSLSITETAGTSTDTSVIMLADMSQVVVAVARDLEMLVSDQYAFNSDQVAVKVTCRYDVGVPQPTGVVLTAGVRP